MLSKNLKKVQQGFTLVEIMIVVLIIGILLAIAVPNFVRAREQSRAKSCSANLKQIESATQQWAIDQKKSGTDAVTIANLAGPGLYINGPVTGPVCPSSGAYTLTDVSTAPTCGATSTAYPHTVNGQ